MQFILSLLLATSLSWAFVSQIPSSVHGIDIPNTHIVDFTGHSTLLRGNAPRNQEDVQQLVDFGVEKIIIFKNQYKTEVDKEIKWLKDAGYTEEDYTHIPFRWKNFESFQKACEQTVEALDLINEAQSSDKTTFFHCTVGEDRTGMLAGLWRIHMHQWTAKRAFTDEMCPRGYVDGSPSPSKDRIYDDLHAELTPIFAKMSELVSENPDLSKIDCSKDPSLSKSKKVKASIAKKSKWRCKSPYQGQWLYIYNHTEDDESLASSYDLIELNVDSPLSCTAYEKTFEVIDGMDVEVAGSKLNCSIDGKKLRLKDTHTNKTFLKLSGTLNLLDKELQLVNYNNASNIPSWKRKTVYKFWRADTPVN